MSTDDIFERVSGDLFAILDGIIDNAGDMINDRAAVETALEPSNVDAYAENAMGISLTSEQIARISSVGLEWVRNVNEGNGEWSSMRYAAQAALDDDE